MNSPDVVRLRIAAVMGLLGIVLGSMGAHGAVHDAIVAANELAHWQTAVQYHLPHAILLVALACCGNRGGQALAWSWRCLFLGVLLFSGSLYLLAYTQQKWLAHVTPFGGLSFMVGWLLLAFTRWPVEKEVR